MNDKKTMDRVGEKQEDFKENKTYEEFPANNQNEIRQLKLASCIKRKGNLEIFTL